MLITNQTNVSMIDFLSVKRDASRHHTLRPRQNGRHFIDDIINIFKRIFLNENVSISIKLSLNFVSKGVIDNVPTLVQIMTSHPTGDNPLSQAIMA